MTSANKSLRGLITFVLMLGLVFGIAITSLVCVNLLEQQQKGFENDK